MKKITCILLSLFLFLSTPVLAANKLVASFGYTGESDLFIMYERVEGGKDKRATVAGTERSMEWTQELGNDCHTFFMTAVYEGVESKPSAPFSYCPETELPPLKVRPGQPINITIQVIEE